MLVLKLLNIQGLTNPKFAEIEKEIDEDTIYCLTETQKKIDNLKIEHSLETYHSMREAQDRKGGGLMLMHQKRIKYQLEERETISTEILHVGGMVGEARVELVLVYMKTGNDATTREFNEQITREIQRIIGKYQSGEIGLIVLGDLNGHLGYLGYQEENSNGRIINDMIEENDLILLNIDERCRGIYTWERGDSRSAIDLVMVNDVAVARFREMEIDENKEKNDLSDHNLITIWFTIKKEQKTKEDVVAGEYYCFSEERKEKFRGEIREKLEDMLEPNIVEINKTLKNAADTHLLRRYRGDRSKKDKREKPWMNMEV